MRNYHQILSEALSRLVENDEYANLEDEDEFKDVRTIYADTHAGHQVKLERSEEYTILYIDDIADSQLIPAIYAVAPDIIGANKTNAIIRKVQQQTEEIPTLPEYKEKYILEELYEAVTEYLINKYDR